MSTAAFASAAPAGEPKGGADGKLQTQQKAGQDDYQAGVCGINVPYGVLGCPWPLGHS